MSQSLTAANAAASSTPAQPSAPRSADASSRAAAAIPCLAIGLAELANGDPMLARLTAPHTLAVSAPAADIQADLANPHSVLVANAARICSLTASDGGTVTLSAAQLMAPGVNSLPVGALTHYRGVLAVTGASVADLSFIAGLAILPDSFALADTAAHISFDLAAGGGSDILTLLGSISGITVSDGAALHLTASQMLSAGVDDGPNSALARTTPAHLDVTSATVAQLGLLAAAQIRPESIHMRDTAPTITAALSTTKSTLLSELACIANIFDRDGAIVALNGGKLRAATGDGGTPPAQHSAASATVAALAALTSLAGGDWQTGGVAPQQAEAAGIETVSASAILGLSQAPQVSIGFAGAGALDTASSCGALATTGSACTALSRDALALAPTEFAPLRDDTSIDEGHIVSVVLLNAGITSLEPSAASATDEPTAPPKTSA